MSVQDTDSKQRHSNESHTVNADPSPLATTKKNNKQTKNNTNKDEWEDVYETHSLCCQRGRKAGSW